MWVFRTQSRVRGLKLASSEKDSGDTISHPITGAWIET
ncbi:Uncharacterised protein [Psychrobacter phenylpyruvicus]|uniref:Uncharacterized protein n=1 Tax=Psychrobacter phenylpyruvicus TaxID=29432 RepID=A0A379LJ48_9GAMM|nr:Uncharacterised protein [Psychrobacter phenylpyruvicus]